MGKGAGRLGGWQDACILPVPLHTSRPEGRGWQSAITTGREVFERTRHPLILSVPVSGVPLTLSLLRCWGSGGGGSGLVGGGGGVRGGDAERRV